LTTTLLSLPPSGARASGMFGSSATRSLSCRSVLASSASSSAIFGLIAPASASSAGSLPPLDLSFPISWASCLRRDRWASSSPIVERRRLSSSMMGARSMSALLRRRPARVASGSRRMSSMSIIKTPNVV
jgi:hypothetical protein